MYMDIDSVHIKKLPWSFCDEDQQAKFNTFNTMHSSKFEGSVKDHWQQNIDPEFLQFWQVDNQFDQDCMSVVIIV